MRRANKVDENQNKIVEHLLTVPGMSVEKNHHDLLVGFQGKTLWVEVKNEDCYSKKTGILLESSKRDSQKDLDKRWKGARIYAKSADDVFRWFGIE